MNPYLNPSFTFLPQNPNPNPNPNPSFSYCKPSSSSSSASFTFASPPPPDLQATLSILKNFIEVANNTVNSISDHLHLHSNDHHDDGDGDGDDFCCCPFDSRHRMLPKFLFRHSLVCPSSNCVIDDLGFLESLHYPNSFKSKDELRKESWNVQSLEESDGELCFSIDDYGDFGVNFFYRDCPGVVCSSEIDGTKRMFTLPSVLSVECANFSCNGDGDGGGGNGYLPGEALPKILPSEMWSMGSEIEVWSDYPNSYSYDVLRVCLCLEMVKESELLTWVISNSPHYGIVIDVPMRDHIYLLLKLCLKAIAREAYRSYELLRGASNERDGDLSLKTLSLKCPILVEVMTWLSSQLSVLYGEVNGKLFSVNMLKRCLRSTASCSLLFPDGHRNPGATSSKDGNGSLDAVDGTDRISVGSKISGVGIHEDSDAKCKVVTSLSGSSIYFSQVAAAVAALHERSLLEEKIKGLRLAGSRSKFQLLSEYSYMSMRAHEERGKRSNYRPILEHDGLLWQRYHNQDSSKTKTREELLAEERDYKRRRMSYRGKKAKRSTTEVMRDIIEQHMEEIKQAGGIGCFIKGSGVSEGVAAGTVSVTADDVVKSKGYDSSESGRGWDYDSGKRINYNRNNSRRNEDLSTKDCAIMADGLRSSDQQQRRDTHGHHEPLRDHQRSNRKDKHNREFGSRSPEIHRIKERSHGLSHERHRHRRTRDEVEVTRSKYDKDEPVSSHRSRDSCHRSFSSRSNPSVDYSDWKYDRMSEVNDVRKERTHGRHRSESVRQTVIDDRYDPSGSDDRYEDTYNGFSSGSENVRLDKVYKSKRH